MNCVRLEQKKTKALVSEICSTQGITRRFVSEHASNFDGLWEAAIKSTKKHLRCVISITVKLTIEE